METLYARVVEEQPKYDCGEDAAIDHLLMAESHLFEEFEGRDINNLLTKIAEIRKLIEDLKNE